MKRLGTSFGSAEPQEPYPLPCLNLITLITYHVSIFSVTLSLSCLPLACLALHTPSRHPLAARVLAYQHAWFCLFFHSTFAPIIFILFQIIFHQICFTDGLCGRSFALLTHSQHHTRTQAIKHVCGGFPPTRPVSPGNICASAPLPPPCPRCGRDHKPNGPFTLVVWFFCIPPTTWAPCTVVDNKPSHEPCCWH